MVYFLRSAALRPQPFCIHPVKKQSKIGFHGRCFVRNSLSHRKHSTSCHRQFFLLCIPTANRVREIVGPAFLSWSPRHHSVPTYCSVRYSDWHPIPAPVPNCASPTGRMSQWFPPGSGCNRVSCSAVPYRRLSLCLLGAFPVLL